MEVIKAQEKVWGICESGVWPKNGMRGKKEFKKKMMAFYCGEET